MTDYFGTPGNDMFVFPAGNDGATAYGLAGNDILRSVAFGTGNVLDGGDGNDRLIGSGGNDRLVGGAGDDYLNGLAGDNIYIGNTGNDTVVLLGDRGDWTFTYGPAGSVNAWDGYNESQLYAVETLDFVLSNGEPEEAIVNTRGNDRISGTDGQDIFFWDPQMGLKVGYDVLSNFGAGDRIVTTTKLQDHSGDGISRVQANNKFHFYNDEGVSMGNVTINVGSVGGAVTHLALSSVDVIDGVTYYSYQQYGDTAVPSELIIL